jgi:hypothetical protein
MEGKKDVIDYQSRDWKYWKSLFISLKNKYEILSEKYSKLEKTLNLEKQRQKIDEMNIKLLRDRMNKMNSSPSQQVYHATSSSNEFDTNSSSGHAEKRLFETFLIFSCDNEEVSKIYSYSPSDLPSCINLDILSYFLIQPEYSRSSCPFPLTPELSTIRDVFSLLYPKVTRDNNSFVFTLKVPDSKSPTSSNKDLLYGCCVQVSDILQSSLHHSTLTYCLLTFCPSFDLHFQVLYRVIEIQRNERISELMKPEHLFLDFQEILSLSSFKSPSNEVIYVLQSLTGFSVQPHLSIKVDLSDSQSIEYEFPNELSLIDALWPCVLVFSLLSFEEVMLCITCCLQECSVVFKSENLAYLSSCVLGLHVLIKPFKWTHVISPILPEQIKEILNCDLPIIAGVTFEIEKTKKKVLWADLASEFKADFEVVSPDYSALAQNCRGDYEKLYKKATYQPTQAQEIACYRIVVQVRKFLSEIAEKISDQGRFNGSLYDDGKNQSDKEFLIRLSRTQIFEDFFRESCQNN